MTEVEATLARLGQFEAAYRDQLQQNPQFAQLPDDLRLQLRRRLTDAMVHGARYLKYALYATLFVCAAYWGVEGDFLDFWDAALWLFAFIFIELNVFEWQHETSQAEPEPEPAIS